MSRGRRRPWRRRKAVAISDLALLHRGGVAGSARSDLYIGARGLDAEFVSFTVTVIGVIGQSVTRPNFFGQRLEDRREVASVGGKVLPASRRHDARGVERSNHATARIGG